MAVLPFDAAADGSIDASARGHPRYQSNDILNLFHPDDLMENFNNCTSKLEQDFSWARWSPSARSASSRARTTRRARGDPDRDHPSARQHAFDPDEQRSARRSMSSTVGIAPAEFDLDVQRHGRPRRAAPTRELASAAHALMRPHAQDAQEPSLAAFWSLSSKVARTPRHVLPSSPPAGRQRDHAAGGAGLDPLPAQLGFDLARLPSASRRCWWR